MAEQFRKNVEAKLNAIKAEIGEIAKTVSDNAVKERLSALSTNVETLVYETLTQTQSSQPAQQGSKPSSQRSRRQESGFAGTGLEMEQADGASEDKPEAAASAAHRAQQASYGGVAQLFMNKKAGDDEEEIPDDPNAVKAAQHKQNISFGGIRQLFEAEQENSAANAEFLVPQDEESQDIAEQKRKHGRHKSIHRRTRSRNSVTDMFAKDGNPKAQVPEVLAADAENSSSEDSVDKQNRLENERVPLTLIQHPLAFDPNRPKPSNWDGVDELFKDPSETIKAPKNWEGVATLFNLSQADSSAGAEYGAAPMKEEIPKVELDVKAQNPTNIDVPKEGKDRHHERHISYGGVRQLVEDVVEEDQAVKAKHEARVHNRNTSFGGVMQIEEDEDDDRHMLPMGLMQDADDDGPETPPGRSGHDRNLSYGGVRQIAGLEEEAENRAAKARAHARNVSIGGVRQISEDDLTNPLQGVEAVQIDIDDGSSNIVSDDNPHPSRSKPGGGHGRKVSYGGVRPLENQDDEDEFFAGDKPRELFDGQARVGDHAGHERRRSRLQDGRELFESPTNKGQGVHRFPNTANAAMTAGAQGQQKEQMMERLLENTQDLARQHLQLKMSKIELIKSTAVEIDRLRDIIRVLASNLKKVRAEHQKLVNATLGTQLAESVSGVFGTLTGFFSPAPVAPANGSVQGRRSRSHSRRSSRASRASRASRRSDA